MIKIVAMTLMIIMLMVMMVIIILKRRELTTETIHTSNPNLLNAKPIKSSARCFQGDRHTPIGGRHPTVNRERCNATCCTSPHIHFPNSLNNTTLL